MNATCRKRMDLITRIFVSCKAAADWRQDLVWIMIADTTVKEHFKMGQREKILK